MANKKPTPIHTPPRGHAKRPPEPIIFPHTDSTPELTVMQPLTPMPITDTIPFPRPQISDDLRTFVRQEVARSLYHLLRVKPEDEVNVVTMSEQEFEAFVARITSGEDV